jgi:hypothetical protein
MMPGWIRDKSSKGRCNVIRLNAPQAWDPDLSTLVVTFGAMFIAKEALMWVPTRDENRRKRVRKSLSHFHFHIFFDKNMIEFGKAGIENEIEYVDIRKQRYGRRVGKLNKDHRI